jgi:hypothetical protein
MAAERSTHETKSETLALELVRDDPPRRRGRPTILTIRAFAKICRNIEAGFSIPNACAVEAISYRSFRNRVCKSERLAARLKEAETIRFNLRHEQALASVMEAGEKSWMAHAWWMERCIPQLYALRRVDRDNPDDKPAEVEIPAERLAHHRALMLELAREDERAAADQPALPDTSVSATC